MSKVVITEQYLEDIADAIRSKTGLSSDTFRPSEMAPAIMTISGGGGIIPTGTISITENGTYNVTTYASADVEVSTGPEINNQNKTVNPTTSQQSITADTGYTGLGTVTVTAMPSGTAGTPVASKGTVTNHSVNITPSVTNTTGYIIGDTKTGNAVSVSASELVSGSKSITSNGTGIDVTNYATVNVNVSGGGSPVIEELVVTPSESEQTFNSSSLDGYKPVTVEAISSTYVGSGITRRSSTDLTVNGAIVNVPKGYYDSSVSKAVSSGSVTGPSSLSGTSASISTGTNTITLTKTNVTTTPTVSAGYVSSATASTATVTLTASATVNPTPTASGKTVTVPAGYYTAQTTKDVDTMTLPTSASSSATSGYTSKATISRSTSDQYINIPTGYNTAGGYYKISAVANGSVTAPSTISGTTATVSTGTNTLTLTKTVSVTPNVTTAGYISSGTAGNSSVSLTASVTTKAATTYHPSTSSQSIASGTYLTGAQTISPVTTSNLSASNIVSGVTIKVGDSSDDDCVASVTGNVVLQNYYTGSSAPSSSLGINGDLYLQS